MLERAVIDRKNMEQWSRVGDTEALFGGDERARRRYPVEWSWQQLLSCGRAMRAPVTEIALSADSNPAVRHEAVLILARLDGAEGLDVARRGYNAGCFSARQFADAAHFALPTCLSTVAKDGTRFANALDADDAWIKALLEALRGRSYEELLLEALDCVMTDGDMLGGLKPTYPDERVKRWLNRIWDQDIDEWLARVAPSALEYRNRELQKGYDPVMVFADCWGGALPTQLNEEAIAKVIPAEDRAIARQLIMATCMDLSSTFPPRTPGWEDRLRAWYRENRPYFKYDPDKLRLVVGSEKLR